MKRHWRTFVVLNALLLAAFPGAGWTQGSSAVPPTCKVRRVIDGDTIECVLNAKRVSIRLLGIDAPELRQKPFGPQAKAFLQRLLPVDASVTLDIDVRATDRYGRLLAYVWNDGTIMVNEELLRAGFAVVDIQPPNVKYAEVLRAAAAAARAAQIGLWATSAFECSPADFRRKKCS